MRQGTVLCLNQLSNGVSVEDLDHTSMLQNGVESAVITTVSALLPSCGTFVGDVIVNTVYNANTAGIQTAIHMIYDGIKGRASASESPKDTVIPIY